MRYDEDAGFALAQASFFEVAARCMRRPDEVLASDIASGRLVEQFGNVLVSSTDLTAVSLLEELRSFGQTCAPDALDDVRLQLEIDYNRLFVGPGALLAPPYESYYASEARLSGGGRLRTEEEQQVVRAYEQYGYALPDAFSELPDHIAVELEYVFLLSDSEARAWTSENVAVAADLQQAQASFIGEHLTRWVGRLSERVRAGARLPFYPSVVGLVAAFCS